MAYSYLQSASNTTDLDTYTFTNQNLGEVSPARYIIVAVYTRDTGVGAKTITSVTVGGVAATIVKQEQNADTNSNICGLAIALVPTGTTGDVVVVFSEVVIRAAISLYRATDIDPIPIDSGSSTATVPTYDIDVAAGGFVIGVGGSSATSAVWVGITENIDTVVEGGLLITSASSSFASAQTNLTLSCTFSGTNSNPVGVFASWRSARTLASSRTLSSKRPAFIGNQPSDYSGLILWLKADAVTGHVDGDNTFTWLDSSGTSHDATSSGTTGPAWRTNIINSLPVFRFSGSNGFQLASETESDFDLISYSIFVVALRTAGAVLISKNQVVANNSRRKLQTSLDGTNLRFSSGPDGGTSLSQAATTSNFNIYSVISEDSNSHILGVNGTTSRSSAQLNDSVFNNGRVEIGQAFSNGAERLTGDIAEVIFYNRALSSGQSSSIEKYLSDKYAISISSNTKTLASSRTLI